MANFTVPSNASSKSDVEWNNVDPASLPKELTAKYNSLRKAIDALAEARSTFESDFAAACNVAAGHKMVFSYRYGLACGVVEEKTSTAKGKVAFGTLARKK